MNRRHLHITDLKHPHHPKRAWKYLPWQIWDPLTQSFGYPLLMVREFPIGGKWEGTPFERRIHRGLLGSYTQMLRSYSDIIDRLGIPLWWDDNGCPRYVEFHPKHMGVYERACGLYDIQCQSCGTHFKVAMAWNMMDAFRLGMTELPTMPDPKEWHYGDPPRHGDGKWQGCTGDTMNSIPYRILEFWERKDGSWEKTLEAVELALDQNSDYTQSVPQIHELQVF